MATRHRHRGAVNWDSLGAGVSIACALHCAALPLLFGLLPGVQLALRSWDSEWHGMAQWLLWSHEAERFVVSTVLVFAAIVLSRGLMRHRQRLPVLVAVIAGTLMGFGAFGHWHGDDLTHVLLQVFGGLGVAGAHILNLRALRRVGEMSCLRSGSTLAVATP